MSTVPAELRYAKSHEWVRLEGSLATVGITDHAQHELTELVFVELPAVGRVVKAHGIRGEVVVHPLTDVPGRLDADVEARELDVSARR